MEKLRRVPRNWISEASFEKYPVPNWSPHQSTYADSYGHSIQVSLSTKTRVTFKVTMEIDTPEDEQFFCELHATGLEAVQRQTFNMDAFIYVMNEGYIKLPALLRHPDKDVAQIAWIVSKYIAQREQIVHEKIVEG
ncbi:MAG: hypothetical protein ACOC80_10310 [Petrotogales bacterium]